MLSSATRTGRLDWAVYLHPPDACSGFFAGSPHSSVQSGVVERGRGSVDLAARQAGVAQRVEVDDVVGLVDDLGDLPAPLVELGGLQPQLEDGLLEPVAPALQRGCQAGPPRIGGDVVGEDDDHRHDAPVHS